MNKEEIIVIGGGVIGLAIAFELRRRGHAVKVLERNQCGGQASGAAAGMLAPFSEIAEDPDDFFKICLNSLNVYDRWQRDVKSISHMDFEFSTCGSYYVYFHEADELALELRKSWQNQYGAKAELISKDELRKQEPHLSDAILGALYYPTEAHVYAPDYVRALEAACRILGVEILEELGDVSIKECKHEICIEAGEKTHTADRLVIATGAWSKDFEDVFDLTIPVFPIRGQICAYDMEGHTEISHLIFSSQSYLTPKRNGTLVSGASEDVAGFSTEISDKGISRLVNWSEKLYPRLNKMAPFHTWAGLRPATQDGFPLLGQLDAFPRVQLAVGHYRNGILLSPITALLMADELEGKPLKMSMASFKPERFS